MRRTARNFVSVAVVLWLAAGGAAGASRSESREPYFPPPESQGGWRTLESAADIERIAGMDSKKLAELEADPLKKYEAGAVRWESAIRRFEELDRTETYPDNALLFVGSSSIRLWSAIKEDMAPYPVIQRGYGGAQLSDVAWYAKRIIYPHRFRALVMFVGNDIRDSPHDKSPEEVAFLFEHIVGTVRAKYPETPIFFIEVTPTNSRWRAYPRLEKANRQVEALCERLPGVYFIKTADHFLGPDGKPKRELFRSDQLHLNRDGYRLWTRLIKAELEKALKER